MPIASETAEKEKKMGGKREGVEEREDLMFPLL